MLKGMKSRAILAALCSIFICQCSKDGLSQDVDIVPLTKNPLIRVSPRKLGSGEIQPQWFNISFGLNNKSPHTVRIEEVLFYVAVDGEEGDPKYFDLSLLSVVDSSGATFDYISYCEYYPGYQNRVRACRLDSVDVDETSGDIPNAKDLTFYIGGIDESVTGTKAFRVRAEFYGVFINDQGVDLDRFQRRVYFTTR